MVTILLPWENVTFHCILHRAQRININKFKATEPEEELTNAPVHMRGRAEKTFWFYKVQQILDFRSLPSNSTFLHSVTLPSDGAYIRTGSPTLD